MNQPVNQAVNHNRFEVTDGGRLRWQRQAARALTALLQNAPVLPPLIWTIGPTGALASLCRAKTRSWPLTSSFSLATLLCGIR